MGLRSTKRQQLQGMQQGATEQATQQTAAGQAQTIKALQQTTRQSLLGGAAPTKSQIQQAGGAITSAQAQVGLGARQQEMQTRVQVAGQTLQEKAATAQLGLQQRELQLQRHQRLITRRLSSINRQYTQEIFAENLRFKKDELGRTLFNERQLADYALISAERYEDLQNYEQMTNQIHARKMKLYELGMKKMQQKLQQEFAKAEQNRNQSHIMELREMEYEFKKKYAEEQRRAANSLARRQAFGSIFGAVVGGAIGILGGPMGVVAGAAAGKAIGGGIASAVSK